MPRVLEIIESADVCGLFIALIIALLAAGAMAGANPAVHIWGRRIAAAAFLTYTTYACYTLQPDNPLELIRIGVRAGYCAGFALAFAWAVLSVLHFVFAQTVRRFLARLRDLHFTLTRRLAERRARRAEQDRRERERLEWEKRAPERERLYRQQQDQDRQRQSDQRRREQARLHCDLVYERHVAELGDAFPPDRYEAFTAQYLSDERDAADVEQRGEQLSEMILELVRSRGKQLKTFASIEEIATYFEARRNEIETLPYDAVMKAALLSQLSHEEHTAIRRFLSS